MPSTPKSCNSPRRMYASNGLLIPIVGVASLVAFFYISFGDFIISFKRESPKLSFVERDGTQFMLDGTPFYVNGWNSYWLMDHAIEEYSRPRVEAMLQAGSKMGLTVCRTWAFNDGDYHALQIAPGVFNEEVFKALDHVIAQARKYEIRLILSLVNNLQAYGGKTQYVKWAWKEGLGISSSNDSFYFDPTIRNYFRSYVKTMLTRKNTITGVEYRDDPTIFAWELMNEPRCISDPSGDTLQDWIQEMSAYVKTLDKKHLVTVGIEGFYGRKNPKSSTSNPSAWEVLLGTDFIRNSDISTIDFASVHMYPDHWIKTDKLEEKLAFVKRWMSSHIEDGNTQLKKPVLFTEFGYSDKNKGFRPGHRDRLIKLVYDIIYQSALENGSGAGSLVWQFFVEGMQEYTDDFSMIPWERSRTYKLLTGQSCRLAMLHRKSELPGNLTELCKNRS